MYFITKTHEEIDDILNDCQEQVDRGGSKFPGKSYEEGVRDAISWLIGNDDLHPMED